MVLDHCIICDASHTEKKIYWYIDELGKKWNLCWWCKDKEERKQYKKKPVQILPHLNMSYAITNSTSTGYITSYGTSTTNHFTYKY